MAAPYLLFPEKREYCRHKRNKEVLMKKAKDDKRLQTIPEGSEEAGAMNRS